MVSALALFVLTQTPMVVQDSLTTKKARVEDCGTGKQCLDVQMPGGMTLSGALTVNIADAGPPLNVNPHGITSLPVLFIQDAGVLNVQGPLTDTQLRATPVPVSGTVTASGPLTDTQLRATPVPVSGTVTASGPLTDTQLRATPVPVSGTVTTTPPSNASTNLAQVAGATTATGNGTAAGSIRVSVASDSTGTIAATQSGTWTVQPGNTANTTPWLATARVVGNTGAVVDAANNAAAPANVLVAGFEAQSSALSTSSTASNVRRGVVGLDGVQYVREGGPLLFTGGVTAIGATLTQVVAAPAASTSLYLTDVLVMSDTATAGTFVIRFGTGSNCVTGTASIYPSAVATAKSMYPGNATAPLMLNFHTPLKVTAANALCILCVATNTCTAQFWGYTGP